MENQAPPIIFSTRRRASVLRRATHLVGDQNENFLLQDMATDLLDRLSFMRLEPGNALIVCDELAPLENLIQALDGRVTRRTSADLDQERPYPIAGFDFIASLGTLDTLNDLPGALIHLRHALAPGGVMIASFLGAGTLTTLRAVLLEADADQPAARVHPFVDTRAAAELMQRAGFARQVVDSRSLSVSYASLDRLVADLRAFGLTNRLASPPPSFTRTGQHRAKEAFASRADDAGRTTERFEILTLTGWAR